MSQLVQSRKSPLDQAFWALIVAICVVMGAGICVMGLGQSRQSDEVSGSATIASNAKPTVNPTTKPVSPGAERGPTFTPQGIQEDPEATPAGRPSHTPELSIQTVSSRGEGLEGIERRLEEIVANLSNLPDRFARNTTGRGAGDQSVEFVREFRQLLETARQRGSDPLDVPPVAQRPRTISRTPSTPAEPTDREVPPATEPGESGSLTFEGGIESADEPELPRSRVARGIPVSEDARATSPDATTAPSVEEPVGDEPASDSLAEPREASSQSFPTQSGSSLDPAELDESDTPASETGSDSDAPNLDTTLPAPETPADTAAETDSDADPLLPAGPAVNSPAHTPSAPTVPANDRAEPAASGESVGAGESSTGTDARTRLVEEDEDDTHSSSAAGPELTPAPSITARLSTPERPPLPVEVPVDGLPSALAGDAAETPELPASEAEPLNRRSETAIQIFTPRHLSAAALARHLEPQLTAGVGDIRSTEDASGRAAAGGRAAQPAVVVRDTPANLERLRRLTDEVDVPPAHADAAAPVSASEPAVAAPRAVRQSLVLDVTAVAVRLNRANPAGIDLSQLAQRRTGFELHSLQESTRRSDVRLASAGADDDPTLSLGVLTGSQQRLLQELRITGPVSVVARSRVTLKDGQATRLAVEEQLGGNQDAQRSSCVGLRPRMQADGSLLLELLDCDQPVEGGRKPLAELRVGSGETAVLAGLRSNRPATVRDPRAHGGTKVAAQPVEWVYLVTPRASNGH